MQRSFIRSGALVALIASFAWSASAAPTTKFSAGGKYSSSVALTPSGTLMAGTITESVSQTITLTPQEEALLNSNTTVITSELLDNYQFSFSEDPKYTPGAKSVKIKQVVENLGIVSNISISAKWGNGQMTFSIKSKTTGPINPVKPKEIKSTRDYKQTEFKSTFKQGSTTIFEAPVIMRYSYSTRSTDRISFDGSQSYSTSQAFKTGPFFNN